MKKPLTPRDTQPPAGSSSASCAATLLAGFGGGSTPRIVAVPAVINIRNAMMAPMPDSSATKRKAIPPGLGLGWVALGLAALVFVQFKGIPAWTAIPIAAAFLVEFPFYLSPSAEWSRIRNPWLLAGSCLLPYLVYSVPTGLFRVESLALLAGLALLLSMWFRVQPKGWLTDYLYLALVAAVLLSKVFDQIYPTPIPKLGVSTLGHLMLIRTSATALLVLRGGITAEYRFLPTWREWRNGVKWSLPMAATSLIALRLLGLWTPKAHPNLWAAVPQFLGILWVVTLSEEFIFRGVLQNWLEEATRNRWAALAVTSIVFGSAHLGFHGAFPNWRFAIVATVFGLWCGLAWRESRSVPTSMVAHAIAATLYRVFF